jgi:LytS/YehU family sensor histidine kinase
MNPHFVFNSLNAIQECIVTGKVDEAYGYLSKFSRLLRLVLEHSDKSVITLQEELEVVGLYISLEKLRFRNEMEYTFEVDKSLDEEEICIPPMLIQPHLENAIWHGLRHKEGEKTLKVFIAEKIPGYLFVVVEDNGVGRKRAEEIRQAKLGAQQRVSMGRQLSGNRMALLQRNFPMTATQTFDLTDDKGRPRGTRIELMVPILDKSVNL